MKLYFITDARFYKTSENNLYSGEVSFNDNLWERYLKSFEEVVIIARVFDSDKDNILESNLITKAKILPIFPFDNVTTFFLKHKVIYNTLLSYLKKERASVIIRGAGSLGSLASKACVKNKIPYGIEVVGDPYDVFAKGVIKHPLRILMRSFFTYAQKRAVENADAVIYVTKYALQKRYPAKPNSFSTFASDVFINTDLSILPRYKNINTSLKLISIGSLEQMYKAPDIAILAVAKLLSLNYDVTLTWLGDGKYMQDMKNQAKELNIEDRVFFKGSVSASEVLKELNDSDIFILLSRTEGLPRALVEAMSLGLPCVGTNIGGIPELIKSEYLVEVNNVDDICLKIKSIADNSIAYNALSAYNIDLPKEYSFDNLERKRLEFYDYIINNSN